MHFSPFFLPKRLTILGEFLVKSRLQLFYFFFSVCVFSDEILYQVGDTRTLSVALCFFGDSSKSFKLFLDLYVTRIPKHPKYLTVPEDLRSSTKSLCKKALDLGGDLKQKLLAEFEDEIKLEEEEEQSRRQQTALQQKDDKSGDFDDLTNRIDKLNTSFDDGGSQK